MSVKLEKLIPEDYSELYEIVSNPEVAKYIGDSKPWTPEKTKKFIEYCIADDKKLDKERDWFTYKITHDGIFAGVIEFKALKLYLHMLKQADKRKYTNDTMLTIFVNPKLHGRGIASSAIKLLLVEIKQKRPRAKFLFSMVREKNEPMHHVMNKLGFVRMYTIKFKGEPFVLYHVKIF
jgi:RimJ/RimL family protein N-acetyltransferase